MHGSIGRPPKPLKERFLAKVAINESTGCWEWQGFIGQYGYGRFLADGRVQQTHRISYEMHKGSIPEGMFVCHHCDNRACVNPKHLFVGTHLDNIADRDAKERQARGTRITEAKLTEEQVLEIRATRGLSQRKLAKMYGISPTQIKDIQLGRYWKHLDRVSQ